MQLSAAKLVIFAIALSAVLLAGCGKQDDVVTQAAKKDAAAGIPAPGITEVKAIAEEGFIYGLPIVMNYAVMYEFAVDKNSSQFKAPFNQISTSIASFTLAGHGGRHAEQRHARIRSLWLDLRAEPMVISVPAVEKKRYYSVQLIDGNTYNYGYIGSRATGSEAGDYLVVGPDWKGETPPGIKKVFQSSTPFALATFRTQLFDAGRHAQRGQGAGRLQGAAAVGVPQAAGAAGRAAIDFAGDQRPA